MERKRVLASQELRALTPHFLNHLNYWLSSASGSTHELFQAQPVVSRGGGSGDMRHDLFSR